jgi:hypothetical protein
MESESKLVKKPGWKTADEITNDLQSENRERIAAGLETLEFHMETLEPVAVAPLTCELLTPFGDELPEEVAIRFHKLLTHYDAFEPTPSAEDVEREVSLAAARFGPSRLALEASLVLKSAENPSLAVSRALEAIAFRGVQSAEVNHAGDFISYLLAGKASVRTATIEALANWRKRQDLAAVVNRVIAELDDEEQRLINPVS